MIMNITTIDDHDYLLVVKALQQQEISKEIPTVFCQLHEEERVMFDEDEAEIKDNDNGVRFEILLCNMKSGKGIDDPSPMIVVLKEMLRNMTSKTALEWCGRLLIKFHQENNCRTFVSSAIKFYLKALEYSYEVLHCHLLLNEKKFVRLLRFLCNHRANESVFAKYLEVFSWSSLNRFALECCPSLQDRTTSGGFVFDDIFKITHEAKIDILSYWIKAEDKRAFNSFSRSLLENSENVICFLHFGKMECFSTRIYKDHPFVESSSLRLWLGINVKKHNNTTARSQQVLQFYIFAHELFSMRRACPKAADALKLLWNCIADPFLSESEFKSSFDVTDSHNRKLVELAWNWYDEHVLNNVSLIKTPRSLCHLSKCSIRKQLATCFQLPCGVEHLLVPDVVKDYILLKEMNQSP